ncbi:heparinase II/III family protein, partial [Acinetobacter baumannii]
AFHSTIQVDDEEQNETDRLAPFAIGDQARPRVLRWDAGPDADHVIAEHYGYGRLSQPITHRRAVFFDKRRLFWLI